MRLTEQTFESHVILSASKIIQNWKPAPFSELSIADFEPAIALDPEIILFGTGERQRFPDNALMTEIMRQGIAFEVMDTAAACRTFNVLVSEFREVVAALLVQNLP